MESRTRWRKGEPGTREGVMAVLDALRDGIGAGALGLFDDDRGDLNPSPHAEQLNFWEAFGGLRCVELEDWGKWYVELKTNKRVETICACGAAHKVHGFLIHDRWALLLVAPASLVPGAAAIISSGLKALAEKLPPGKKPTPASQVEDAELGYSGAISSVWWVRPTRH